MENTNAIEVLLLLICLFTMFRAVQWYVRVQGDGVSAKIGSVNAQRIASGQVFEARVLLYRVACFALLWGRSMFTPDDPTGGIWNTILGVAFIVLMVLELILVRRKKQDQDKLEAEAAAKIAAGHVKRADDPEVK